MFAELDAIELGERVAIALARDSGPMSDVWVRARLRLAELLPYVD
jgi:hypothetical protein